MGTLDDVPGMCSVFKDELADPNEVVLSMDSGETVELHLGPTTFDEPRDGSFTVEGYGERQETGHYDGAEGESVRLHSGR